MSTEQGQSVQQYSCSQLFGYKSRSQKLLEEDNITTLNFDHSGNFLAIGDKAGRLIIFQSPSQTQNQQEYDYFYEFQAHTPDFDTLKNSYVEQQIQHINWMRPQGKYLKMLTANSHIVKLWKMYQKTEKHLVMAATPDLSLPHLEEQETSVCVNLRRTFPNRTFSPLHTCRLTKNEQFLFTSDETAMFLWSLQKNTKPFLLRQTNSKTSKNEHKNKITCAALHPYYQNILTYGTSKGQFTLIDSRQSLLHAESLHFKSPPSEQNFINDIIKQYTSISFLPEYSQIITRDLLTIKNWDIRQNREPLHNIYVDQQIRNRLHELFQAEVLTDRFHITTTKHNIITGNYSNSFQVLHPFTADNVQYELDFGQQTNVRKVGQSKPANPFNYNNKILAHDYNQATQQLAIATNSCFFIFSQKESI